MKTLNTVVRLFAVLVVLTGVVYPFLIYGVAQLAFNHKANGSMIELDGKQVGSLLIGQSFDTNRYFWSRPSAVDYQSELSSGSNLAVSSSSLKTAVEARDSAFRKANKMNIKALVPADMLFASASGLDPHISPQSAQLQKNRIIASRKMNKQQITLLGKILEEETQKPQFLIFGEPRVNVLHLNIRLDKELN